MKKPPMHRGLERILSKAGVCSRTQAALWIRSGRVRVNGVTILDPDAWFDPERDLVTVDGQRLRSAEKLYYAFHKPRGYLTTRTDPGGRPTIYDLFEKEDAWLIPVGRLDLDTSGLLLLTNDTHFAERVTNPESRIEKTYQVEARPRLDLAALERLRRGVVLHDGPTRPARVENVRERGPATIFELSISEGRNRQVRRMVKEVGARVSKLARISIGEVLLGDLPAGALRPLSGRERRALGA
jgi:23S rRNA pseudouridine2605 synthase